MNDDGLLYCYEQPLNERVRTFLRLEHLRRRFEHHAGDTSVWGRRAAMDSVVDLLNVMSRHDIRGQVSKALAERRAMLARLADREDIDERALASVLANLDTVIDELARIPPRFASYLLRDDELLDSVNNRSAIAGGTCGFDLPAYQYWLDRPQEEIDTDIAAWTRQALAIERGAGLLLGLLRDSARRIPQTAAKGVYLHNTSVGTQLIRVFVADRDLFPEISAGRHRATVRFMQADTRRNQTRQSEQAVEFELACCDF